jgi:hypothetical protein
MVQVEEDLINRILFSVTPDTTVGASTTLLAEYGATSSSADNNTISGGIVVTLESNIEGVLLDAVAGA